MSLQDIQIVYNESQARLADLLAGVRRPGDYFCSGALETPMPSLSVEEVGVVSFPVPPEQARRMIAVTGRRAPYGRGDRTLVDETVRKVWQIAPQKISFRGTRWESTVRELAARVGTGMGCEEGCVEAQLYKMLVYDEGGFFAPHRDTEKVPGMFGTLVVSLPSAHEGGLLVVRHAAREATVDLCNDDAGEIRFAAFYADCEHEVEPVTAGHRVCLVYNLVYKRDAGRPVPPDNRLAVKTVVRTLRTWATSGKAPRKLAWLLEHHYTQAALSWSGLKGSDAARADVLRQAAAEAGCAAHLGIVHIEESGWAEFVGGYGGSYWDDEEDDDCSEYEIGEVCDGRYYIDHWRDAADNLIGLGEIPLGEGEALPAGALDNEQADQTHFSEATGNEGASFERTYLRAAVVLWPDERTDEVCASGGPDAAIARFGQLVGEAGKLDGSRKKAARDHARRVAGLIPLDWEEPYQDHGQRLETLLRHLRQFQDGALIARMAPGLLAGHYAARHNDAVMACAEVLSPARCRTLLSGLLEQSDRQPGACLSLWTTLSRVFARRADMLEATFNVLLMQLPKARALPQRPDLRRLTDEELLGFAKDIHRTAPADEPAPLTPEVLETFLGAALSVFGAGKCRSLLDALSANPTVFAPETLLLPCLELMSAGANPKATAQVTLHLWRQCASFYLGRSASPPPKPTDWSQPVLIPGTAGNRLLQELEAFARDPAARQHRFTARKELRRQLHQAIDHAKLDMTHVTERRGSPFTLVCTKTRATYEQACRRYRSDLADMRCLLALPPAKTAGAASLAKQLRRALPPKRSAGAAAV